MNCEIFKNNYEQFKISLTKSESDVKKFFDNTNDTDDSRLVMYSFSINIKNIIDTYIMNSKKNIEKFFISVKSNLSDIYNKMKMRTYRNKDIQIIDIDDTFDTYKNYLDGLDDFVTMVLDIKPDDDLSPKLVEDKISLALNKDYELIDKIFMELDDKMITENIDNAMKQVEFLIDYNKNLEILKNNYSLLFKSLNDSITNKDEKFNKDIYMNKFSSIFLYIKSISSFNENFIKSLIDILDKINDTLNNKHVDNDYYVF